MFLLQDLFFFRVKNTAHAFMQIVKEAGLLGLWKGCVPNVQRAALVNLGGGYCEHCDAIGSASVHCILFLPSRARFHTTFHEDYG